jgi:hypothetical protein
MVIKLGRGIKKAGGEVCDFNTLYLAYSFIKLL